MKSRVLSFGFYGEGVRDYGFLSPIVKRTLEKLLPYIDILEIPLDDIDVSELSQIDKMIRVAEKTCGYGLVVFHLDADAPNTKRAFAERFEPGYTKIQQSEGNLNKDIVPVIPVRMTDAWMLVDFAAFQKTVGTRLSAKQLGFKSKPQQVESIQNPKAVFEDAVKTARPGRRRTIPVADVYRPLAIRLNLEELEKVPAYQEFLERLVNVLTSLGYRQISE